jgi:hypothetical protein
LPPVNGATIPVRLGWMLAPVLALNLFALTSLCYASPPDQTWIAGLYDDADHDDAVVGILNTYAVPPPTALSLGAQDFIRTTPSPALPAGPDLFGRTSLLDRSPPLA